MVEPERPKQRLNKNILKKLQKIDDIQREIAKNKEQFAYSLIANELEKQRNLPRAAAQEVASVSSVSSNQSH